MTLRYIPSPPPSTRDGDAATPPMAPALSRLRDWCCIGCAAIGLAVSINFGTCEPQKPAKPPAGSNLSTLAPIMQTSPNKGGEGTPRQSLRCPAPKAARMAVKTTSSPRPDEFAV
ncbi:hypothetical protein [Variovorax sp. PAMC26660]|uniref:hypothetical protein n=1 Tax=Variovorax sp. PAMC26660 TaxID=2762322 RepID=UPI00164E3B50|nr:hypothetical protein [Variovorax sp. PAMC26660]QNK70970.1 hypothetical protein H7F35_15345 [Variovorax sp. PAMC26660]